MGPFPKLVHSGATILVVDGIVWVLDGLGQNNEGLRFVDRIRPNATCWEVLPSLPGRPNQAAFYIMYA